jgi:hypothetical protein
MVDDAADRPLLVETVPGERAAIDWVPVGQAMAFLGSLVVIMYATMSVLSGPGLAGGWEGAWFVPRTDFDLVCPAGLGILLLGIIVYYMGRRQQGRGE